MPSALNCVRDGALMLGAVARDPPGKYLTSFGYISSKLSDILIINGCYLVRTGIAYAFFPASASFLYHF